MADSKNPLRSPTIDEQEIAAAVDGKQYLGNLNDYDLMMGGYGISGYNGRSNNVISGSSILPPT